MQLVAEHHVGMARGTVDIINGEAAATEKRVAKLQRKLLESRATLAAEQDPQRSLELLKQHVALQDALLAELLQAHGHHHGSQHGNSGDSTEDEGGHEH